MNNLRVVHCAAGIAIMLFLFGCAAAKPAITSSGSYQSNEHSFIVPPPQGWSISLERPNLPQSVTPQNTRYTERAYLSHPGLTSVIMVESKRLTWARRNIHPMDILLGPGNINRWQQVCKQTEEVMQNRASQSFGNNVVYTYECYPLKGEDFCIMPTLCKEKHSTVRIFANEGEFNLEENSYVSGEGMNGGPTLKWNDMGWRIAIVWYGPEQEKDAARAAMEFLRTHFTPIH